MSKIKISGENASHQTQGQLEIKKEIGRTETGKDGNPATVQFVADSSSQGNITVWLFDPWANHDSRTDFPFPPSLNITAKLQPVSGAKGEPVPDPNDPSMLTLKINEGSHPGGSRLHIKMNGNFSGNNTVTARLDGPDVYRASVSGNGSGTIVIPIHVIQ